VSGGWPRYLVRRLLQVIPALWLVVTATFVLVHIAPGSPVIYLAGEQSSPEFQAELAHKFGLDRPLPEQYARYLSTLATGDFGRSIVQGRPVAAVIGERVPATLLLILPALALSALLGVCLGLAAGRRQGSGADRVLMAIALAGQAVPVFVIGLVAILVFSVWLGALPVAGMRDLRESYTGPQDWLDVGRHMVLPVTTLALGHVAVTARITRAGVSRELRLPYATTALAKGRSEGGVAWRHVLRNVTNPILTALGNEAAILLGGAVITERIFGWPGLGQLTLDSALSRDYPVLLGVGLLAGAIVTGITLLVELIYPVGDPRVTLG